MIGVLVFPNFQLLDAAGPISVFEIAARFAGQSPSIKVLAVTPGPVRSSSCVEMLARGLKPSGAITTLLVAGGEGAEAAVRGDKTLNFVRTMARRGFDPLPSGQNRQSTSLNSSPTSNSDSAFLFKKNIPTA